MSCEHAFNDRAWFWRRRYQNPSYVDRLIFGSLITVGLAQAKRSAVDDDACRVPPVITRRDGLSLTGDYAPWPS
jgi:hypothetical protein